MVTFPLISKLVIGHRRVIAFLLIFAYAAFRVVHPDEDGRFFDLLFLAIMVMLMASQVFWIRRDLDLAERIIPGKSPRVWARGHCECCLSVLLRLQLHSFRSASPDYDGSCSRSRRSDPARGSDRRCLLVVGGRVVRGLLPSHRFLGHRLCGAHLSLGLQSHRRCFDRCSLARTPPLHRADRDYA